MTKILLGTDPEIFLSLGGKAISAAGILPGTKKEPFRVDRGAVQVDGNAFEFNIDPVETAEEFNRNIETVLHQMKEMVSKIDKDICFEFKPIVEFDPQLWEQLPPEAKILGCDPDFSATADGQEVNPSPAELLDKLPVRTAAGHIHIGWTSERKPDDGDHFQDCKMIAREFFSRGAFKPKTKDEYRRLEFYGANGAFRPKSYGVELRSPSNLWVENKITRIKAFNLARSTFEEITGM